MCFNKFTIQYCNIQQIDNPIITQQFCNSIVSLSTNFQSIFFRLTNSTISIWGFDILTCIFPWFFWNRMPADVWLAFSLRRHPTNVPCVILTFINFVMHYFVILPLHNLVWCHSTNSKVLTLAFTLPHSSLWLSPHVPFNLQSVNQSEFCLKKMHRLAILW